MLLSDVNGVVSMKKIAAFFMAFVLCASMLSFSVSADSQTDELGDYLASFFVKYDTSPIDLEPFVKKYGWSGKETLRRLACAYYSHPEFFYVYNGFEYSYIGDEIKYVRFEYVIPKDKLAAAQKILDDAAKKAIAGITPRMNDVDKALYVHDYLILNCAYDTDKKKYSGYNCLVDKECVCQGYSLAYEYILNKYLGIECTVAYSDETNHIWNYVKIGNKWYHVDLTLDDRLDIYIDKSFDRYGSVLHENFLMSDSLCRKTSDMHRNWVIAGDHPAASDKSFDNAFWRDIGTRICYADGCYYYTQKGEKLSDGKSMIEICRYEIKTQKRKILAKLKTAWYQRRAQSADVYAYGTRIYNDIFSSVEYINGKLYFNSNKCVYSFVPLSKAVKKIYTLDKGESQIFGMVNTDGKLRVLYKNDITYPDKFLKLVFV